MWTTPFSTAVWIEQFVRRSMYYVQRFDCTILRCVWRLMTRPRAIRTLQTVYRRLSSIGMYLRSLLFRAFVSGVFVRLDLFVYLAIERSCTCFELHSARGWCRFRNKHRVDAWMHTLCILRMYPTVLIGGWSEESVFYMLIMSLMGVGRWLALFNSR